MNEPEKNKKTEKAPAPQVRVRVAKKLSYAENRDLENMESIKALLKRLAGKVAQLLLREKLSGKTITLKVRYEDFSTVTRSITSPESVCSADALEKTGLILLERTRAGERKVRLMGLSVSGFSAGDKEKCVQLELPLEW